MPVLAVIPLAAVVIAVVVLLFLYGYVVFAKATGQLLPDWHILGFGSIRSFWVGAAESLYNAALHLFYAALSPVADFMRAPVVAVEHLFNVTSDFLHEAVATASWIISTAIPRAVNALRADVNKGVATLRAETASAVGAAERIAASAVASARAYAFSLENDLRNDVNGAVARLTAATAGALSAAKAYAYAQVLDLRNDVNGAVSAINGTMRNLYNDALAYADKAAAAAAGKALSAVTADARSELAAVWPSITSAVAGAATAAEGDFADVTAQLRAASKAVPVSIPGALAAIGALAVPMIKLAEDCTIPNCKNLSQLGRDFQSLLGLVEDGALLAFVVEAIHDPSGTADSVASEVSSVMGTAASAFDSLIGV